MREAPKDDTLESMYKTKLNDSQLLETTFVLCNQDTVQQNQQGTRLNQITQDRNFDARKDRTASGVRIRRKADERSKNNDGTTRGCRQWVAKGKCSKGASCSFKHAIDKKEEVKANVIDQVLLRRDHDHKAKTVKMKNRATKGNVPTGTSPSGKPNQPSCFSNLKGKCTKPSCNCWHPPLCVKHKTNEGCQFWESVRFVSHNNEAPRKMSKKRTRHLKITILQFYAVIPNWVVHLRTSNYQNKRLDLRT